MFNRIGSISGIVYQKARGIGYRLGFLKSKQSPEKELQASEAISLPRAYENWFPKKEEELNKVEIRPDVIQGKVEKYARKPLL